MPKEDTLTQQHPCGFPQQHCQRVKRTHGLWARGFGLGMAACGRVLCPGTGRAERGPCNIWTTKKTHQTNPKLAFAAFSPSCFPSWEVLRGPLQPDCG